MQLEIGITDAKGDAVVILPMHVGKFGWVNYAFGIEGAGLAPIHNLERFDVAADHDATSASAAIAMRVPAGDHHRLRVVAGEQPMSVPLVLRSRGGSIGDPFTPGLPNLVATTGPDGRLEVHRVQDAVVVVLTPNDVSFTVVAWTATGCTQQVVPAAPRREGGVLRLQLTAATSVPGVVVGKDGKPVAGAVVQAWVSGVTQSAESLASAIRGVTAGTAPDGTFRLPLYPGLRYSLRGVESPVGSRSFDRQWTVGRDAPAELLLDLAQAR